MKKAYQTYQKLKQESQAQLPIMMIILQDEADENFNLIKDENLYYLLLDSNNHNNDRKSYENQVTNFRNQLEPMMFKFIAKVVSYLSNYQEMLLNMNDQSSFDMFIDPDEATTTPDNKQTNIAKIKKRRPGRQAMIFSELYLQQGRIKEALQSIDMAILETKNQSDYFWYAQSLIVKAAILFYQSKYPANLNNSSTGNNSNHERDPPQAHNSANLTEFTQSSSQNSQQIILIHNQINELLKGSLKYIKRSKCKVHHEIEVNFTYSIFLAETYQILPLIDFLRSIYEDYQAPKVELQKQVELLIRIAQICEYSQLYRKAGFYRVMAGQLEGEHLKNFNNSLQLVKNTSQKYFKLNFELLRSKLEISDFQIFRKLRNFNSAKLPIHQTNHKYFNNSDVDRSQNKSRNDTSRDFLHYNNLFRAQTQDYLRNLPYYLNPKWENMQLLLLEDVKLFSEKNNDQQSLLTAIALMLSLHHEQLTKVRQKQLLKQIAEISQNLKQIQSEELLQQNNQLNVLNLPSVLKIELIPNKAKQTRKRVVIREDSINSINSQGDNNNQIFSQSQQPNLQQSQSVFVYAPWQNKNSDSDNIDNQNRYLNYESDSIIIMKVTLNNPLAVNLVIQNIELLVSLPDNYIKAQDEQFTLKPNEIQTIFLKAYCTKLQDFTCALKGLRLWLAPNTFCDHYLDRRGNSYYINKPDYQVNKIDPPNAKQFTIDLDNIRVQAPSDKLNLLVNSKNEDKQSFTNSTGFRELSLAQGEIFNVQFSIQSQNKDIEVANFRYRVLEIFASTDKPNKDQDLKLIRSEILTSFSPSNFDMQLNHQKYELICDSGKYYYPRYYVFRLKYSIDKYDTTVLISEVIYKVKPLRAWKLKSVDIQSDQNHKCLLDILPKTANRELYPLDDKYFVVIELQNQSQENELQIQTSEIISQQEITLEKDQLLQNQEREIKQQIQYVQPGQTQKLVLIRENLDNLRNILLNTKSLEVKWLIDQGDHVRQGLIDDFYHKLQNLVPSHTSPFIVTRERINVKELDQEQQQDILHYEFSIKINQIYLNNLNAQNNPTTKTQSSKSISLYSPYKQKNQQSTLQLPQLTQDLNQSSNQNSSKSGSGDKNRWIVEFIVYQVLNQQNTIKEKYELFEGCTKMLIDYKEFSQSQQQENKNQMCIIKQEDSNKQRNNIRIGCDVIIYNSCRDVKESFYSSFELE
eukprot:403331629